MLSTAVFITQLSSGMCPWNDSFITQATPLSPAMLYLVIQRLPEAKIGRVNSLAMIRSGLGPSFPLDMAV